MHLMSSTIKFTILYIQYMDKYSFRKNIRGISEDGSLSNDFIRPQFTKFYIDFIEDGCGMVLKAKKKFKYGEKLLDLCGSYISEPLDAIKLYEKCQECPNLHRTKFFIQSNESFYCCDMENSASEPCYYLFQRRTTGYNCRPTIYYSDDDTNKLQPKISIEACTPINKGDPIVVYYGVLWFLKDK